MLRDEGLREWLTRRLGPQAADPLEPGRILIFERWQAETALLAFRQSDPDGEPPGLPKVLGADVKRYEISSVGPA